MRPPRAATTADTQRGAPACAGRRRALLGIGAVATGIVAWQGADAARPTAIVRGDGADVALPPAPEPDAVPAIAARFPFAWHGGERRADVQIAHALRVPLAPDESDPAPLGERTFLAPGGARVVPWAPLFRRGAAFGVAPEALRALAGCRRLWIKDDGSDEVAALGNKERKYELSLANLAASRVRRIYTHGSYGSNHCAHLAIAIGRGGLAPERWRPRLAMGLYPQRVTRAVAQKLALLAIAADRLELLDSDAQVGISIARRRSGDTDPAGEVYVPSGGSSPVTVIGHVNAVIELAAALGGEPPPDVVVLPLGSGATSMGVVLGCHVLGWSTRVLLAPTQERSPLAKIVVNRDLSAPFALPHAVHVLEGGLGWARRLGLPVDDRGGVTAEDLVARHVEIDRGAWRPAYGELSPEADRLLRVAAEHGLVLDPTFTGKAFAALAAAGAAGKLRDRTVLFWNTYPRFDVGRLIPPGRASGARFPGPLARAIDEAVAGGGERPG